MPSAGVAQGNSFACGVGNVVVTYSYRYKEGSILYICNKARTKGVMEAICVKSVRLMVVNGVIPIYVDTTNRLWNEDELCTESAAKSLAITYLQNLRDSLERQLEVC